MPLDLLFKEHFAEWCTRTKKFRQGKAQEYIDSEETKVAVTGGYCEGASLVWLRLSLDKDVLLPSKKDAALVSLMAQTQVQLKLVKAAEKKATEKRIHEEADEKEERWFNQAEHALYTAFFIWCDELGCAYRVKFSEDSGPIITVVPGPESQLDIGTIAKINRRAAALAQRKKAKKLTEGAKHEYIKRAAKRWNEGTRLRPFTEAWDRIAEGVAGFDEMVPVTADDGKTDSCISDFVCRAIAHPSFSVGRGLLITFRTGFHSALAQPVGHSIAILKRADGKYSIFDPNLGVYSVEGRYKLIGAIILLLIDGYGRRTLDKQDNWTLFCKTDDLVPSLQPEQSGALEGSYLVRDHALGQMLGFIEKTAKEAFERIDAYKKAADKLKRRNEMLRAYDTAQAQKANHAEDSKEWKAVNARAEKLFDDLTLSIEDPMSRPLEKLAEEMIISCLKIRFDFDRSGEKPRLNDAQVDRFWQAKGNISASPLAELAKLLEGKV